MEENLPRVSHKYGAQETVTTGNSGSGVVGSGGGGPTPTRKKSRYDEDDAVECGDRNRHRRRDSCGSCSAALIADCVALCCCPCAVVNLLTLALVKVPWKIGRRCLGRRKKAETKRKCGKCEEYSSGFGIGGAEEDGIMEILSAFDGGEGEMYAAEKVWLELYEVGRLGFGRVSFTGVEFET